MARPWPLALLMAITAVVYGGSACRWVEGADSGELATLFAAGGVAHPPGYPLHSMLLAALSWLPVPTPALGASLTSALTGLAAAWAWHRACLAWGASAQAALLAVAIFVFSPLAWGLSTEPEVFALAAAIAGAIAFVCAPNGALRGERRAVALGLAFGLGACAHHTLALLFPLGLFALVLASREAARAWRAIALVAVGLLVGLLPYAWLLHEWNRGTGMIWGGPASLDALLRHFLRADYGTFQLAARDEQPSHFAQLGLLGWDVSRGLLFAPLAAVVAGFIARGQAKNARLGLWALLASWVLAGPVFALLSNIAPTGLGALIVERFHLLPLALLLIPLALGVDSLRARTRSGLLGSPAAVVLVAALAFAASQRAIAERHRPTVEQFLRNTFSALPPRAVLFADSDQLFHGYSYLSVALHERPDVDVVSFWSLRYPWYRAPLEKKLGVPLPADSSPASLTALVRTLQTRGREVLMAEPIYPGAPDAIPFGPSWRFLAEGETAPDPAALERENDTIYSHFTLDPDVRGATGWTADVLAHYGATWLTLADAYSARGDAASAARCRAKAEAFAP